MTRADLEPHYDAVEAIQAPQRFPLGAGPPYAATAKTIATCDAARRMGLPVQLPPLAVRFAPGPGQAPAPGLPVSDGRENVHGVARRTCRMCGECDLGCNDGAKDTVDLTFLSRAWQAGATIRSCCEVTGLDALERDGFRVTYRQHVAARDGHPEHLLDDRDQPLCTVRASEVVIAAGAVGTPALLLANRVGLPGLSRALGQRVSGNGDYIGWVRNCTTAEHRPRYLHPSDGPVITASISIDEEASAIGRGYLIQDAGAPAFTEWLWQGAELPGDVVAAIPAWWRRFRDKLHGRRDSETGGFVAGLFGDAHASAAMMPMLAMGRDVPSGRYTLAAGGRLELDWTGEADQAYYDEVRDRLREFAAALGGELLADPLDRISRSVSVHMVGGAPMATDPRIGVVDPYGAVHGYPGLWIADGSVLPGPVGVNPSFTIAALAHRTARAMLGDVT